MPSGSYAKSIAEVFPLGPCTVAVNGNDLGHTDESGVKLTLKATIVQTMVSAYGKVATNGFLNGQQAEADFVIMQTDMTILAAAFPGATPVTNAGGSSKLTFGLYAATKIPTVTLTLTPLQTLSPISNFTMIAYPAGDFEPVYEGGKWAGYKCKFVGVVNESGASNGSFVGQFGDSTITADATAPSVSGVVPANAATGVATSATVIATITKALQGSTVNTSTVTLVQDPTGTPVEVVGSVALVNNGASTTVTFTPTSALTASKSYVFVMSPNILGQNSVALTSFLSHFAT